MNSTYLLNASYAERTRQAFDAATEQYPRLAVFRADLRFPIDSTGRRDERVISRFIDSLKTHMASLFSAKRHVGITCDHPTSLRYIWCREYGLQSGNRHYHVVLLLNKDAFHQLGSFDPPESGKLPSLANLIQKAWCSALSLPWPQYASLVWLPSGQPVWVEQNSAEFSSQYSKAYDWALYLSKEACKQYGNGRSFGCSQDKPSVIGRRRKSS
ncbi:MULTISPECIES: inovirus Gp2 family protein [Atlantibacter]|uniref:inovirus Gp2 family protein n=1 Tax=Atlantibacter TaxID=1903434 RepID=UPI002586377F|nr:MULTISPECIES: inovirus Gp2 family protein [Atlantibacter]